MKLKPPIGISDFREVIETGLLYVDKSLMVEEVLETTAKVQLITRPRRFGKTINISMLRYFFDCRIPDSAQLFQGLAIEKRPCFDQQGKFPVIQITFKDLTAPNFNIFFQRFASLMSRTFRMHEYLLDGMGEIDRDDFMRVVKKQCNEAEITESLSLLMRLLRKHHNQKVMVLLDEYDSPMHEAHAKGYYDGVLELMRPFLGLGLKDNLCLEKAVLTGILRIAKESIFSDLNNVATYSVLDDEFGDKFGFTVSETNQLLKMAGREQEKAEMDQWYNGYVVGETVIYNPWSILSYLAAPKKGFKPYWVNTSANLLVRDQILDAEAETRKQLIALMEGQSLTTMVQEQVTFRDLTNYPENLWSFLLFSGYLKASGKTRVGRHDYYDLAIPNDEVASLFETIISKWFSGYYGNDDVKIKDLLDSLIRGDMPRLQERLGELVASVLSYHDTDSRKGEHVYHAFVLGMLVNLVERYEVRSQRESGLGRYDVMLRPRDVKDPGIVMEFKIAEKVEDLDAALDEGLKQIEEMRYGQELEEAGIQSRQEIAVAFCGKLVKVRGREIVCP